MPLPAVAAWIGLGANLGNAAQTLRQALGQVAQTPGIRLVRASSLYRTAPVDAGGGDFINAVAHVATTLLPLELLRALMRIEAAFGRERPWRNAPRTLDLDLLLYGDVEMNTPQLTLPHPRMWQRAFVLAPLAEISPELVTPAQLQTVAAQRVERLDLPWTVTLSDP